ncbi:uncharacterized protein FTOL_13964 [Fusarium torulosum]|uniref:Uncharacterized protein n=1 Tax=Fusarium torulosum TaxID=33205 RepID=A0AAE8MPY5_9HYPO|nr:uncharacterized protein FTOL_13964 [Fusarium torulosum]
MGLLRAGRGWGPDIHIELRNKQGMIISDVQLVQLLASALPTPLFGC